ncbi:citrate/2-methylcitrate synthase, partial [Acinetobacter baumannii]
VHLQCQQAWNVDARAAEAIRVALVLCADHELNASSFAARVVASTGASLGAVVSAGLAALTGGLHGGTTARVEALLSELEGERSIGIAVRRRL